VTLFLRQVKSPKFQVVLEGETRELVVTRLVPSSKRYDPGLSTRHTHLEARAFEKVLRDMIEDPTTIKVVGDRLGIPSSRRLQPELDLFEEHWTRLEHACDPLGWTLMAPPSTVGELVDLIADFAAKVGARKVANRTTIKYNVGSPVEVRLRDSEFDSFTTHALAFWHTSRRPEGVPVELQFRCRCVTLALEPLVVAYLF
jgi:hypothetical protein